MERVTVMDIFHAVNAHVLTVNTFFTQCKIRLFEKIRYSVKFYFSLSS